MFDGLGLIKMLKEIWGTKCLDEGFGWGPRWWRRSNVGRVVSSCGVLRLRED